MRKDQPPIIEGVFTVLEPPALPPGPRTRSEIVRDYWSRLPQPVRGILSSFQVWWLIAVVLLVGFAEGWS